jgi:hypothetical protein
MGEISFRQRERSCYGMESDAAQWNADDTDETDKRGFIINKKYRIIKLITKNNEKKKIIQRKNRGLRVYAPLRPQ